MWRWILGIMSVIILAVAGTCYVGFRRITAGGDTVVTTVPGAPTRVFTLLTDRDSLLAWLPEGSAATPERHGALQAGDTVRVAAQTRSGAPAGRAVEVWIVRHVKAPDVLAIDAFQFDPGGVPHLAFARRDSLSAVGDSTRITSTFAGAPIVDGAGATAAGDRTVSGSLLSTAEKMRVGAARLMWQNQLRGLARRMMP